MALLLSRFLFYSYQGFAVLFIAGSKLTWESKVGVTQGDPLAMHFLWNWYSSFNSKIKIKTELLRHTWYANDSGCFGLFKYIYIYIYMYIYMSMASILD